MHCRLVPYNPTGLNTTNGYLTVFIDQSQLCQRQRKSHTSREQFLTRLVVKLLIGLPQIPGPRALRSNRTTP